MCFDFVVWHGIDFGWCLWVWPDLVLPLILFICLLFRLV